VSGDIETHLTRMRGGEPCYFNRPDPQEIGG
jgi:hypothetical protein